MRYIYFNNITREEIGMKKSKKMQILIPEGNFEGNCYSCFYVKSKSMDSSGRMFCSNDECKGRYIPDDREGCPHYTSKVIQWLKIGGMAYLLITFFVVIIENFLLK